VRRHAPRPRLIPDANGLIGHPVGSPKRFSFDLDPTWIRDGMSLQMNPGHAPQDGLKLGVLFLHSSKKGQLWGVRG